MSFSLNLPEFVPSEWKNIPTPISQTIQVLLGQLTPLVHWVNSTTAILAELKDAGDSIDTRFKKYVFEMAERIASFEKRLQTIESLSGDTAAGLASLTDEARGEFIRIRAEGSDMQSLLEGQMSSEKRRVDEMLSIAEQRHNVLDAAFASLDRDVTARHVAQMALNGEVNGSLGRIDETLLGVAQRLDDMDHTRGNDLKALKEYQQGAEEDRVRLDRKTVDLTLRLGDVGVNLENSKRRLNNLEDESVQAKDRFLRLDKETTRRVKKIHADLDDHATVLDRTQARLREMSGQMVENTRLVESADRLGVELLEKVKDLSGGLTEARVEAHEFQQVTSEREARRDADSKAFISQVEGRLVKMIACNPTHARNTEARFQALEERLLLAEDSRLTRELEFTETLKDISKNKMVVDRGRGPRTPRNRERRDSGASSVDREEITQYTGPIPGDRSGTQGTHQHQQQSQQHQNQHQQQHPTPAMDRPKTSGHTPSHTTVIPGIDLGLGATSLPVATPLRRTYSAAPRPSVAVDTLPDVPQATPASASSIPVDPRRVDLTGVMEAAGYSTPTRHGDNRQHRSGGYSARRPHTSEAPVKHPSGRTYSVHPGHPNQTRRTAVMVMSGQ